MLHGIAAHTAWEPGCFLRGSLQNSQKIGWVTGSLLKFGVKVPFWILPQIADQTRKDWLILTQELNMMSLIWLKTLLYALVLIVFRSQSLNFNENMFKSDRKMQGLNLTTWAIIFCYNKLRCGVYNKPSAFGLELSTSKSQCYSM